MKFSIKDFFIFRAMAITTKNIKKHYFVSPPMKHEKNI